MRTTTRPDPRQVPINFERVRIVVTVRLAPALTDCQVPEHDFRSVGDGFCPWCQHDAGPWEVDLAPAVFDTAVFADSAETASPDE